MSTAGRGRFATTRWSVVLAAGGDGAEAEDALATLCETYWYPLYAYARRRGSDADEARDLTQGFFATLLEREYVKDADQERGRFRGFMATAFRRYCTKVREYSDAEKRGGGRAVISLDFDDGEQRYLTEAADDLTPERLYERRWALTLLDEVVGRVREHYVSTGRPELFDALRGFLGGSGATPTHREIADRLGMSPGAVKVAVHRLRRRYRDLLREEIARTVSDDADVDAEIRHLIAALRS